MQIAAVEHVVQSSGALASAEFGISQNDVAHIMGILRSTLYTRKALAVLREYGANAWDEHRESGQPTRPIQVQIPTHMKPVVKIRDFGRGLSEAQVLNLYTQYGLSTKRDSNTGTGMLGIGCKAGFAYADQFTISSWFQGTKSVYVAVIDKSRKGAMNKIHEEPCGDETGIEIQVAVQPKDVDEFTREARGLFRYFNPQPVINMTLPTLPAGMVGGFILEDRNAGWLAVMGCIPYRLDIEQMQAALQEAGIWDTLGALAGGVYVPIGQVEFSASREELQYTDVTIKAIVAAFQKLLEDYAADAFASLQTVFLGGWEKRMKAAFLSNVLKFPLPKDIRSYADKQVRLHDQAVVPQTFTLRDNHKHLTQYVNVRQDARVLIQDDMTRRLDGWNVTNSFDVVAAPVEGKTYAEVQAELEGFLRAADLTGMPIVTLSSRAYWTQKYPKARRPSAVNQKHRDRTFTLNDVFHGSSPYSDHWSSAVPPEEEHVFVIIRGFEPQGHDLNQMQNDKALLIKMGKEDLWPAVYGYKSTDLKPVLAKDIDKGTPYATWRTKTYATLLTEKTKAIVQALVWADAIADGHYYATDLEGKRLHFGEKLAWIAKALEGDLGPTHLVTRYFRKTVDARRDRAALSRSQQAEASEIALAADYACHQPQEWWTLLAGRYPMIGVLALTESRLTDMHPLRHYDAIVSYIIDQDKLAGGSTLAPEA